MLLTLALLTNAQAAPIVWPAGHTVPDAVALHLTDAGLDKGAALVPAFIPTEPMDIPPMAEEGSFYSYSFSDGWVAFEVLGSDVQPGVDELVVVATGNAWVNDAADPFMLTYDALLSDECPGYVSPFPWEARIPFKFAVMSDKTVDVTIDHIDMTLDLTNEDIHLDCNITYLEMALDAFGYSLYGMIIDMAQGEMETQLQEQIPDLEAMLEDALNQARYDGTMAMGDITLHIKVEPHEINVTPAGLEYVLEGSVEGDTHHACVAAWDEGFSTAWGSPVPAIADDPAGTELGVLLSDDFTNQALYSLWAGGLLCYDLASGDPNSPVPVDGGMVGLLAGEAVGAVVNEDGPAIIRTVPSAPPVAKFDGGHDLDIVIDPLGLDLFAEVDYRMARPLSVDLLVDAGTDLILDSATGELKVVIDMGAGSVETRVVSNEFAPEATAQIEAELGPKVISLLEPLLGSFVGDMSFALPAFEGLGMTSLDATAAGPDGDWLGLWATLGEVSYGAEGCSGGCSAVGSTALWWAALAGGVAIRRRRR
ncbi:MAG: hypothetical protein JXX28_13675 [Deltaproteobacteria bacterium]|nr:hypothetical protein [Deltaproteobacteria bacterium]